MNQKCDFISDIWGKHGETTATELENQYWITFNAWFVGTVFEVIQQARQLTKDLKNGFSPQNLVDELFLALPGDAKKKIKNVIHDAYLENSGIVTLQQDIEKQLDQLKTAADRLKKAWVADKKNAAIAKKCKLKKAFVVFKNSTDVFLEIFEKIPQGYVLP